MLAAVLYAIAQHQVDGYLIDAAARRLAAIAHGGTFYRWRFSDPRDLVGRRAFGMVQTHFDGDGVHVTAERDGTVEFGVVLPHAVDLERYPRLTVLPPTVADLVVRERFGEPERIAALSASATTIDLRASTWHGANAIPQPPPRRAAMLRLRVYLNAGNTLTVAKLRLDPDEAFAEPDLSQPLKITSPTDAMLELQPRFALDSGRPETRLTQRDTLIAAWPTAIVLPNADTEVVRAKALAPQREHESMWSAFVLYAASLIALRLCPPRNRRLRAAGELTFALAGPLTLVLGGAIGDDLVPMEVATLIVALAFSLSLKPVAHWRVIGDAQTWWLASMSVLAALVLALMLREGVTTWPSDKSIARYFVWAVLQQYFICIIVADRLRAFGVSMPGSVLITAFVFSLLHAPNATLMQFTFCGSLFWTALWWRRRALLPIAAAHAASALTLAALLPTDILRSFEISARFVS